ncbi:hypothetical protein Nepgr_012887 [Nepenthes gracilis]|uniref:Uncharacterized protein n=1 Tax=Nepenthes gracilis TaxID=150966 RepID=A0AAD3SHX5_NEPGR|nr:hypothetical protein Nepgr_012887 [Nepenthes gracilis]
MQAVVPHFKPAHQVAYPSARRCFQRSKIRMPNGVVPSEMLPSMAVSALRKFLHTMMLDIHRGCSVYTMLHVIYLCEFIFQSHFDKAVEIKEAVKTGCYAGRPQVHLQSHFDKAVEIKDAV